MATLVNIRIHTQSKAVPNANDITIEEVSLIGNTIVAMGGDVRYVLGVVPMENIVVETPSNSTECGCNTTNANIFATLIKGVDGVTPDMSDYYDKNVIDEKLGKKQDVISDLKVIRSGASKGATALQSVPSEYVTERELQERGYATRIELESKQNVISDLDAIREGASKGATAVQPNDIKDFVTEGHLADVALTGSYNDLNDTPTFKTINGESIVGEGNIEIEGGSADLEGYATEEYVNNAVEAVNVKGEDDYVYSNGEKVDMRIRRSLIPIGTLIPAKAKLNTIAYLKVGNYYCSQTSNAKTIENCPVEVAFSMEVFNPLSENLDDETTAQYTYRIRKITAYNTGVQYIQYCNTSGTAGTWTYGSWYVIPRTSFSLASDKNGGSAVKGGSTRGVYIDASGTFQQMGYTIATSVPKNAVFTDTDTKVTAVGNHYTPAENADEALNAPEGEVVVGLKRDAAGHVVGVMSTPMSGNAGGGGGGGITVETDPIFSASPAASITDAKKAEWDGKYAKPSGGIPNSDLSEELREKLETAHRNAMAYQGTVTNIKINGVFKSADNGVIDLGNLGTYSKPSTGIPKSDLNPSVQTSLGKADTAVQPADIREEVYIADFTIESLRDGMNNGTNVDCNVQGLVDAMNANKVILVREGTDSSFKGVYVLNGFAEDLLYFSIVDTSGNVLYCDGADYWYNNFIDGKTLFYRSWDDKQDKLQSGENIKTINGENILGSGDITIEGGVGTITGVSANGTSIATSGVADIPAASTSKYGVTKLTTLTNSSSTTLAATASAVKTAYDLANSKQDKLESGTNIKTINGESILGEGDMLVGKITYFSEEDRIELSPNVVWIRRGSVVNSVQITGFASNGKDYEEYAYHFYTGTIADGSTVKLMLPKGVKFANKEIFDALESDTHYELSVVRSNGFVKAVLTAFK